MPNGHIDACRFNETGACTCKKEAHRYLAIASLSFLMFTIETAGGIITGSLALLSDAFHTLFDGSESILSAVIAHRARFTKNETRLRKIGGILSAVLISIISWFILEEAVGRLAESSAILSRWAIAFAIAAFGINLFQFRIHEHAPDEHRNITHAWQKFHIMTDIGASMAAIIGVTLSALDMAPHADAYLSIGIVVIIWVRVMRDLLRIGLREEADSGHHGHHH